MKTVINTLFVVILLVLFVSSCKGNMLINEILSDDHARLANSAGSTGRESMKRSLFSHLVDSLSDGEISYYENIFILYNDADDDSSLNFYDDSVSVKFIKKRKDLDFGQQCSLLSSRDSPAKCFWISKIESHGHGSTICSVHWYSSPLASGVLRFQAKCVDGIWVISEIHNPQLIS